MAPLPPPIRSHHLPPPISRPPTLLHPPDTPNVLCSAQCCKEANAAAAAASSVKRLKVRPPSISSSPGSPANQLLQHLIVFLSLSLSLSRRCLDRQTCGMIDDRHRHFLCQETADWQLLGPPLCFSLPSFSHSLALSWRGVWEVSLSASTHDEKLNCDAAAIHVSIRVVSGLFSGDTSSAPLN